MADLCQLKSKNLCVLMLDHPWHIYTVLTYVLCDTSGMNTQHCGVSMRPHLLYSVNTRANGLLELSFITQSILTCTMYSKQSCVQRLNNGSVDVVAYIEM